MGGSQGLFTGTQGPVLPPPRTIFRRHTSLVAARAAGSLGNGASQGGGWPQTPNPPQMCRTELTFPGASSVRREREFVSSCCCQSAPTQGLRTAHGRCLVVPETRTGSVLETGRTELNLRCGRSCVPSEGSRGEPAFPCLPASPGPCTPWLMASSRIFQASDSRASPYSHHPDCPLPPSSACKDP